MRKTSRTKLVAATFAAAAMIAGVLALAQPAEATIIVAPAPIPDCFVVLCAPCPDGTYPNPVPDQCCPECIPLQEY